MKVSLVSLGCPKNLFDSEQLLAILSENEFLITDSIEDADVVIINTCAFIKDAVEESIETIKIMIKKNKEIIIWGCLPQRERGKLLKFKNIKGIVGVGKIEEIIEILKNKKGRKIIVDETFSELKEFPRLITTFPYAYIKISEGCQNNCSYCLIPKIRGPLRSRKIENILKEAESIKNMGYKEIILIAQDTTNYGMDFKDGSNIVKLLKELEKFDFEWIRLMYAHPGHISEELIEKIGESKKICKYLDIPLQHISPEILKKMNRPILDYKDLILKIRKAIPDIAIRTNFIIGFPGETENDFNLLLKFIEDIKINRVGFFKYSNEKGTIAYNYKGQIKEKIKEKRLQILVEKQKEISKYLLKKYVGKKLKVLIEKKESNLYIGRTEYDAPDIDGVVYIKKNNLKIGNFYELKITNSDEYDLYVD